MRAEVVPATLDMVPAFAAAMRPADVREVWSACYATPTQALTLGMGGRGQRWAGFIDGEPVCMFGVASQSLLGRTGRPWMLGTPLVERHATTFLRRCRPYVNEMRKGYDSLENWVDERNQVTHRWLRWLGFTLDDPAPFGVEGRLFRRFEWRAS